MPISLRSSTPPSGVASAVVGTFNVRSWKGIPALVYRPDYSAVMAALDLFPGIYPR